MIRTLLASVGLAAITLTAAAGIQASGYFDDGDGPPPRMAVSYAGLDLTNPAGVRLLERRINAAIDDVCPRDWSGGLRGYSGTRDCRERAIRGVEPHVRDAIDRAWDDAPGDDRYDARGDDDRYPRYDHAWADRQSYDRYPEPAPPLPPPPPRDAHPPVPPPPPPASIADKPLPGGRLIRRTVTTTVTTTVTRRGWPEPPPSPPSAGKPHRPAKPAPGYARRPSVPGSWLPPVAWQAIERATVRAFATGRLTRWHVRDRDGIDRDGYVTVSAERWLDGRACRAVRAIKQNGRRQLVVAEGTRCRRPGGGLTA